MRTYQIFGLGFGLTVLGGCGRLEMITIPMGAASGSPIVASGRLETETRRVGKFTGIEVGSIFTLHYKTGPVQSVRVSAPKSVLSHIKTEVEGGTLKVDLNGNFENLNKLTVDVVSPHLTKLSVSGAAEATCQGVREDQFAASTSGSASLDFHGDTKSLTVDGSGSSRMKVEGLHRAALTARLSGSCDAKIMGLVTDSTLELGGSATMAIDKVDARNVTAQLSGASALTMAGQASRSTISATGASHANLSRLTSQTCGAAATGASEVKVKAIESLNAVASGASHILYSGSPHALHQSTTGVAGISIG